VTLVLQVNDARKRFGETVALAGASLDLRRGEWLGLLGPNGAGKTTLVRAIAGRVRLDGGAVDLLGRTLDGTRADMSVHRRLGIVPQELALYPLLTARENLHLFGSLHGVSPRALRDRVAWALEWTGLGDRDREPTRRFSGGMKRRLNIACGVLHEPEVVLLDEPTVGVDPQSRQRIWEMLGELREGGTALLLTTHQLDEAQQVCERIVIIDHGRAIANGSFTELLETTIGVARRVTFEFDGTAAAVTHSVTDVARELPELLAQLAENDASVTDVRIEAPSLQSVFIHLTGRELRE